jgi:hypothetical protein
MATSCNVLSPETYFWNFGTTATDYTINVWMNPGNNAWTQNGGLQSATVTIANLTFQVDWTSTQTQTISTYFGIFPATVSTLYNSQAPATSNCSNPYDNYPTFTISWPMSSGFNPFLSNTFVNIFQSIVLNYDYGTPITLSYGTERSLSVLYNNILNYF